MRELCVKNGVKVPERLDHPAHSFSEPEEGSSDESSGASSDESSGSSFSDDDDDDDGGGGGKKRKGRKGPNFQAASSLKKARKEAEVIPCDALWGIILGIPWSRGFGGLTVLGECLNVLM
jgi:hypothetical protein